MSVEEFTEPRGKSRFHRRLSVVTQESVTLDSQIKLRTAMKDYRLLSGLAMWFLRNQ